MAQYREFITTISLSDDDIVIKSHFGSHEQRDVVARDGSENTNFGLKMNEHKAIALSLGAQSTSPPCTVANTGRWTRTFAAGTPSGNIPSSSTIINVPAGNSGNLTLSCDSGTFTMKYSLNGGAATTFVDGDPLTVADGDTLAFSVVALGTQEYATGSVTDDDTGSQLDTISFFNSTVGP